MAVGIMYCYSTGKELGNYPNYAITMYSLGNMGFTSNRCININVINPLVDPDVIQVIGCHETMEISPKFFGAISNKQDKNDNRNDFCGDPNLI